MQQKNSIQIHVEDTNAEATAAKISAIKHKYFQDEFSEELVKGSSKKDVLIHRGYWCRFNIFHRIVSTYISKQQKCNIISLGSGYDTLPFIMWQTYQNNEFTYVEVDLPVVVDRKINKLKESNKLKTLLGEYIISQNKLSAKSLYKNYLLFGEDLCNTEQLYQQLKSIDFTIPTLVYAECVLTYINSESTNRLLDGLTKWFPHLTFLNYEMFNPNDQFGKMMVQNFEYRGCPLVGIDAFPSLQAHKDRLNTWFNYVEIYDMKTLYQIATDSEERKRIEKLELMDEWEEWNIMQSHYLVSLANKDQAELIVNLKI
ncbi:unnamed protein product [Paramecium primaurelia]|uniref:Leucine carboxyl methyltransferase 1 n=1 Tax=Paramecium primaurelia TaxID=5886 RepID=A0A8S1MJK7_PARPR|nr:unnamed protein product [Paramecium primaurelia]